MLVPTPGELLESDISPSDAVSSKSDNLSTTNDLLEENFSGALALTDLVGAGGVPTHSRLQSAMFSFTKKPK